MRIIVFGAPGRTGRLVVEKALGHGHKVTAFVHETPLDLADEHLTVVKGDARDLDGVRAAVAGHNAVAFALSARSGGQHVHEQGIANVLYAMAEDMVPKLAAVSAAGTFARTSHRLSIPYRALISTTMRSVYDDLEAMERRIMASGVQWTIVRPYGLSDDLPTGHYRVTLDGSLLKHAKRISRGDVAALLVKALETDTYRKRTVVIGG